MSFRESRVLWGVDTVRRVLRWGTFLSNVSTGAKPENFRRVPDVLKQREDMKKEEKMLWGVVKGEGSFKVSQLQRGGARIRTMAALTLKPTSQY